MTDIVKPDAKAAMGASLQQIGLWGLLIQLLIGAVPTVALAGYGIEAAPALGRFQILHMLSLVSAALLVAGIVWFSL